MKDNRGVTLIEVLLAFAVSAIVLTAISGIIFTSLHLFGRTSANVEVQSEAQTAMSLIADNIMDASGICMKTPATGTNTDCVLLDKLEVKELPGGNYEAYFSGSALVTDIDTIDGVSGKPVGEIYLVEFPNADYPVEYTDAESGKSYCRLVAGESSPEVAAEAALAEVNGYVLGMDRTARTMWLLSRYVTACRLEPAQTTAPDTDFWKETVIYEDTSEEDFYYFKEPVTVRISLSYENNYGSGNATGNLEDEVSIRSRVKTVFANIGDSDGMKEYRRWQ